MFAKWKNKKVRYKKNTVQNTPEEFENVALFLRSGLPSTLICHENAAFRHWTGGTLRFSVDRRHFEKGAFWKRWHFDNRVISLTDLSSTAKPGRWFLCFQIPPAHCGRDVEPVELMSTEKVDQPNRFFFSAEHKISGSFENDGWSHDFIKLSESRETKLIKKDIHHVF